MSRLLRAPPATPSTLAAMKLDTREWDCARAYLLQRAVAGKGKPSAVERARIQIDAILHLLATGCSKKDYAFEGISYGNAIGTFNRWEEDGTVEGILTAVGAVPPAEFLAEKGRMRYAGYGFKEVTFLGSRGTGNRSEDKISDHPEVLRFWDMKENAKREKPTERDPARVGAGNRKDFAWRCPEYPEHTWTCAPVTQVRRGDRGCPTCCTRAASAENNFLLSHPEMAAQWDYEANAPVRPENIPPWATQEYQWRCLKGPDHIWTRSPFQRATSGSATCPACENRQPSVTNVLATLVPQTVTLWDAAGNEGHTPYTVVASSWQEVALRCSCGHTWRRQAYELLRTKGNLCAACAHRVVSPQFNLATEHPGLAAEWSDNNELRPEEVHPGLQASAEWLCSTGNPDHHWETRIDSRTRDGWGCPYCSGQRLLPEQRLAAIHPEIAAQWHPTKNTELEAAGVTAETLAPTSPQPVWWLCEGGHEWEVAPHTRAKGSRCPYCIGQRATPENCLAALRPDLAAEWHPTLNEGVVLWTGEIASPEAVVPGSPKRVFWQCRRDANHVWPATIASRAYAGGNQTGCPECCVRAFSRPEIRLRFELGTLLQVDPGATRVKGSTRSWQCDVVLESEKVVIEFDGSYWHKDSAEKDLRKSADLEAAGWKVIRLREAPLPMLASLDAPVPTVAAPKQVADAAVTALLAAGVAIPGVQEYLARPECAALPEADAFYERAVDEQLARRAEKKARTNA